MYGNDVRNSASASVVFSKNAPAGSTIPDRDNQFRIRDGFVSALQGLLHIHRYWAGYQQHVRMTRACNELDSDAFKVVIRVVECMNFQFASVAGSGIDLANAEGATQDVLQILLKLLDHWSRF